MTAPSRRLTSLLSATALSFVLLAAARAGAGADTDVDGGVASDAGTAAPDSGVAAPAEIDAAVFETLAPPPPPSPPPDLTLNETSATLSTTMAPAPPLVETEIEPPRPITRRLWFWLAVSGAVVAASLVVMATQNPTIERPDCPAGYVCPR